MMMFEGERYRCTMLNVLAQVTMAASRASLMAQSDLSMSIHGEDYKNGLPCDIENKDEVATISDF